MRDIFVFGSNMKGTHGAGAALEARKKWGAELGVGVGATGNAYAIPTKYRPTRDKRQMPLNVIQGFVDQFIEYANNHDECRFLVVRLGCGLAGYTDEEIGPMFKSAPPNVVFEGSDWEKYRTKEMEMVQIGNKILDQALKEEDVKSPCNHDVLFEGDICPNCMLCMFLDDDSRNIYVDKDCKWIGPVNCLYCQKKVELGRLWCDDSCADNWEASKTHKDDPMARYMDRIVCVTGHRPSKLGGYDMATLVTLVRYATHVFEKLKPTVVITGMAMGWDIACAAAALKLGIPYRAYIPGLWQPNRWHAETKDMYYKALEKAESVANTDPDGPNGDYSAYKLQVRNERMVNDAELVLALWDGTSGGTKNCVDYAKSRKKTVVMLWDKWQKGGW